MRYKKVYVVLLVGNRHHLSWFLLLIIKQQQWQLNNYKQALILSTLEIVYKYCNSLILRTDDRKIAGSQNLVLNSNVMKYFKNTQNFSTRVLLFV